MEFAQAPGEEGYTHNTTVDFGGVQAKVVKLTIVDNWADGTKQASLSEVRFFYVPVKAFGPSPATGSTGIAPDVVLNWRPGRLAVKHQVAVSSDADAVTKGTAPIKTVGEHTLALASMNLEYGRTYFWKVNEVNEAAVPALQEGDLWSFTVIDYAVVDDFETYDDLCDRVFFAWVDGFGHGGSTECQVAASSGNGTGSTVGNINPPFAEQRTVHSGKQSMPVTYDNSKTPFYSEIERQWPTPQAWTGGGVNTLVVFLRGEAAGFVEVSAGNSPEPFYVAVQDSAGKAKIVSHPDQTITATGNWEQWSIPLSQFSSAGVNVGSIKKVTVGTGDRDAPKAGGAGKLLIDDIRLIRVP